MVFRSCAGEEYSGLISDRLHIYIQLLLVNHIYMITFASNSCCHYGGGGQRLFLECLHFRYICFILLVLIYVLEVRINRIIIDLVERGFYETLVQTLVQIGIRDYNLVFTK
jgi:hypothetical protein